VLKMLSAASSRRVGVLLTRVDMRRYRRYSDTGLEPYPARPVTSRPASARQSAAHTGERPIIRQAAE
jgi:hypothetical protein